MAFDDCEPITLDVCTDCVQHLANGEGGCCHVDYVAGVDVPHLRRPEWDRHLRNRPAACPTALRIERLHRGLDITLGCADPECGHCRSEDGDSSWFSMGTCDGCGVYLGGDREHATVWARVKPVQTFERNGWAVTLHGGRSPWIAADRAGDRPRSAFSLPRDGSDRYAHLYMFAGTLPA